MNDIQISGFQFAGLHCGIKEDGRKKDLSVIYSEEPETLVDGVFTTNRVCAPTIPLCRRVVKGKRSQLIVINSGNANACTGKQGISNALATQKGAAKIFGLHPGRVCVSSTGKIGVPLPLKNILDGLEKAKHQLSPIGFHHATQGIMTTDQWPKFATHKGRLKGQPYTIAVLAKGAGMLRPDMATMLAYVVTDLKFSVVALRKIFRNAVNQTLNCITVDGDMSTNDTVLILANGRAGNPVFSAESTDGKRVEKELTHLLHLMAQKITLDGEGATKCCEVNVQGAKNHAEAKKIAYAIGNSPLVKTALFGCDPNWGRIMAAVGYSGAKVRENKIDIKMGRHALVERGRAGDFFVKRVSKYMKNEHISMTVNCHQGPGEFHIYMSDLTYDYIHLNAEYHT